MSGIDRRTLLQWLGSAPLAAGFAFTGEEARAAGTMAQAARAAGAAAYQPKFFTAHEWETVRVLVDLIIPKDERSGSATDAGVPEFMDFILIDEPRLAHENNRQTAMRGGLAYVDLECQKRFDKTFVACTGAERAGVLDDLSQPLPEDEDEAEGPNQGERLPPLGHGRRFFASFRDLTASGFWTTKMGIEDLQYQGNRFVSEWKGCPDEALKQLCVSYPPA